MEEFVIVRGVLKEYCGTATEVEIPAGVRRIGKDAFHHYLCRKITKLTLPEGVTQIGDRAFQNMERLETVVLPSTLKTIGDYAFVSCRSLKTVSIPEGVTALGKEAFGYCEKLETVQLPPGLTQIPEGAFRMCASLTGITIPEGVTAIGSWAFSWCFRLRELRLPDGLQTIGEQAFYDCRELKTIHVSDACVIDPSAFGCCFGLADPYGLVILQKRLLVHCPTEDEKTVIPVPDFVETIQDGALVGKAVRHVEMNLRCPLWESGESAVFGYTKALVTASGSTIAFRDNSGKIVAKVILAVEGERGEGRTYGLLSIRQKDHAFDFACYDACWEKLQETQNRLKVALVRLQYPYALSQRARQNYESVVAENSAEAGKLVIDEGETELLGMLLKQKLLQREALYELVDYANRVGDPTLTAQLLTALHADTPG